MFFPSTDSMNEMGTAAATESTIWPGIKASAEYWRPYTESGRRIAALCYLPSKGHTLQEDAFYTYACAMLSGFQWADWFTAEKSDARVLYTTRLGKPRAWMRDAEGVAWRVFERGVVLVNHSRQARATRLAVPWKGLTNLYTGQPVPVERGKAAFIVPADSGRVYVPAGT